MSLKTIYEQLGLTVDYEEEVTRFNERLFIILDDYYNTLRKSGVYKEILRDFAFRIGTSVYRTTQMGVIYDNPLTFFFDRGNDVLPNNLVKLASLLFVAKNAYTGVYEHYFQLLTEAIKELFEACAIDIDYFFNGQTILKKGAKELDDKLISGNLTWLSDYPNAKEPFENALKHYLSKDYPDAITNAYSSLESLVKTFLGRDKSLDNQQTRAELIKKLELDGDWGQLLNNFSKIAHAYSSRHGKSEAKPSSELSPDLVEFYLYMTGTFVRLITQRMQEA